MMQLLWVALGGALGATLRYLVTAWVQQRVDFFPWGTLVVNLLGSFLIGMVLELTVRGFLSSQARLFLAVGLLGGFTTFSSLSWETLALVEDGDVLPALAYAGGSLVAGIVLAWFGSVVARWLWSL
ncbi:fluoride efflux transporter CrcB [Thermomicrobium sp. 4228-Ro]|uniref:fluoride efflux transporter CrcB n=1 Tax=Thermomicrobium sp. 4228-Ro TaxID=2993937 RepID=UPI0022494238|nr:fluoride efflux transporter CrcB [Thermomicrobium sp. 4228-Ro]MCX2726601.1 fluoride efflux transporter CrcB [Thermomicrobium sp. 4228-Ro]